MIRLKSKVQYKNFEQGEYVSEKLRSFDETLELIGTFPWKEQREDIHIDFTNPGIVVESENGIYLQIALYYNQKFVLRYFNGKQKLYTRSLNRLQDSYDVIREFYKSDNLDLSLFKKEISWVMPSYKVFKTKSFEYELNKAVIFEHVLKTSLGRLIGLVVILCFIANNDVSHLNWSVKLLLSVIIFSIFGGLNLLLLLDHFFYFKNKKLKLSKGNDTFYFGVKNDLKSYEKQNIKEYLIYNPQFGAGRNLKPNIRLFIIIMDNGDEVIIPNIFFSEWDIKNKLNFMQPVYVYRLPFIPAEEGLKNQN
ncbi:MAG: hypothetical protein KDC49_14195 [Saprospiraceae bacterium]|nr:hypothetical protein [Saprospiraceae bacterium]